MLKQICFFKKRSDMTMEQFMDYYENQHSQLAKKIGKPGYPKCPAVCAALPDPGEESGDRRNP